jgi:hypothetical protein
MKKQMKNITALNGDDQQRLSPSGKWMSVRDLARRWGISESAVYNLKAGTDSLQRYRFGSTIRFKWDDVLAAEEEILTRSGKTSTRNNRGGK